jgi:hypothetical protein
LTTARSDAARHCVACAKEPNARMETTAGGSAADPAASGGPPDVRFFDHVLGKDQARVLRLVAAVVEARAHLVRTGAADQSFMRAAELLAAGTDL